MALCGVSNDFRGGQAVFWSGGVATGSLDVLFLAFAEQSRCRSAIPQEVRLSWFQLRQAAHDSLFGLVVQVVAW